MLYLLDTNILLAYLRKNSVWEYVEEHYQPFTTPHQALIAVVTAGEILSLALQNQWGVAKRNSIREALAELTIIGIHTLDIQERYAEIDAYSQNKILSKPLPKGLTARNMGKTCPVGNWIAACASILEAKLITTDQDFNHLHQVYLDVIQVPFK